MRVKSVARGIGICGIVLTLAWMHAGAGSAVDAGVDDEQVSPLDPSSGVGAPVLESKIHTPLAEQYMWTATQKKSEKVLYMFPAMQSGAALFSHELYVDRVPRQATLYIAGPRSDVWVMGSRRSMWRAT